MNRILEILLVLLIPLNAYALNINDSLDINGFLGYKFVNTSNNTKTNKSYIEAGLLVNYNISESCRAFIQLNFNEYSIEVDYRNILVYGFLEYTDSIHNWFDYEISAGKLKHEFGLHSNVLQNPSTRTGIVPPQAMYWQVLSSTLTSGYGVKVEIQKENFNVGYTISEHIVNDAKVESTMWSGIDSIPMDPYFGSYQIFNISYEPMDENWLVKSDFVSLDINKDITGIEFLTLGVSYNNDDWWVDAESIFVKPAPIEWDNFDKIRYGLSITLGKYIDNFETYINVNTYQRSEMYDVNPTLSKDVDDWRDINVGAVYHDKYYRNMEYRAEVHYIEGGRTLHPDDWDKDIRSWWLIGASIVYHF